MTEVPLPNFVATPRNGVMKGVLDEISFIETSSDGKRLTLATKRTIPWANIVSVKRFEPELAKLQSVSEEQFAHTA